MMESLKQSVKILKTENSKLKSSLSKHLPKNLIEAQKEETSLLAGDGIDGNCSLDNQDYNLVKALQTAQQNFVVTDPTLPDNPIVFASNGFLALTGYTLSQVLGRNCRFLQGPETDLQTIAQISEAVKLGEDHTTMLLNYRSDGTSFWNQLFIAALRDGNGCIVNYLGVQCGVSEMYAAAFFKNKSERESREGAKL
jgi:PAS domain S-box-containing protein